MMSTIPVSWTCPSSASPHACTPRRRMPPARTPEGGRTLGGIIIPGVLAPVPVCNPLSPTLKTTELIRLNIGGKMFVTTAATLTKTHSGDNFFSGLLSGRMPSIRDDTGAFFLDRNGSLFEPLLDFLRTGELHVPHHVDPAVIAREAAFYCIALPCNIEQYHVVTPREFLVLCNVAQRAACGLGLGVSQHGQLQQPASPSLQLPGCDLRQLPLLRHTSLERAMLTHVCMSGMDLHDANLANACLADANLSGCDLSGANLDSADLSRASLQNANLHHAHLQQCNCTGADLSGANLSQATLTATILRQTILTGANLSFASLYQAAVQGANLDRTDLTSANLQQANFTHASLVGAILTNASTTAAIF
ncbi:FH protein interacting protein FIP2 [Pelomyxa schiedti]|nr:FH protein interacting protein FIP2 [Pelomyxa schiedti]